ELPEVYFKTFCRGQFVAVNRLRTGVFKYFDTSTLQYFNYPSQEFKRMELRLVFHYQLSRSFKRQLQTVFGKPAFDAEFLIGSGFFFQIRSEEHTSELQSRFDLVCR